MLRVFSWKGQNEMRDKCFSYEQKVGTIDEQEIFAPFRMLCFFITYA